MKEPLIVEPFLHVGNDRIYNPLTDRMLDRQSDEGQALTDLIRAAIHVDGLAAPIRDRLFAGGWLILSTESSSERFLLKYVTVEAHTVCNQACYFCPVSIQPRKPYFMPSRQYEDIVRQLATYRDTLLAVFMSNYNEPTVDRRLVDQVRVIRAAGLPPAVNTNGTGLTPDRVDALMELGGLAFLSVNFSTLDPERCAADRGHDHVALVLRNLDYLKDRPLAPRMDLAVLGTGDEEHRRQFEAIGARFAGSRLSVFAVIVSDRAGYLHLPIQTQERIGKLRGCEQTGSRPLQHLHITARAKVVLCCQDYGESVEVGDLNRQSVAEVLRGSTLSRMRRWTYGLETAPDDYICRRCKFALTE